MENLVVYKLMGFNKRFLPNLATLKKEFDDLGIDEFVRLNSKYDSLSGPQECLIFIDEAITFYNQKKQEACITSQK